MLTNIPRGRKTWAALVLGLVLALGLLAGYEAFWRSLGFSPSVGDSRDLWAYHRARVYEGGRRSIVLVGASAMAQDIDTAFLGRLAPGYRVTQLAVPARAPMSAFIDLCDDPAFKGTVILSASPQYFGPKFFRQQASYVQHYHQEWRGYKTPVILLRAFLEQRLVFMNSNMNVLFYYQSFMRWWREGVRPQPFYVRTRADRSQAARYTPEVVARRLAAWRAERGDDVSSLVTNPEFYAAWKSKVDLAAAAAERLRKRRGRVVAVMLPLGGEYRAHFDRRYPPEKFWGYIAARLGGLAINYAEAPALSKFVADDGTHLDQSQAGPFTEALAGVLKERGVIEPDAR